MRFGTRNFEQSVDSDFAQSATLTAWHFDPAEQAALAHLTGPGTAAAFAGTIGLSSLSAADGFKIEGEAAGDLVGGSVSSAGDFNGDGYDDFIVGAAGNDTGGDFAGAAYVIFGKASGLGPLDLASLSPADGFKIIGQADYDQAGASVSSAGDINGDGFDDIIVAAHRNTNANGLYAGAAYVIFGKASGFGTIDLDTLASDAGFKITGQAGSDGAGRSVSSLGDINGDHIDDIVIGANFNNGSSFRSGAAYVIFGKTSGLGNIDLNALPATSGFKILGEAGSDYSGRSVSSAGDVNGDGFNDILVGSYANDSVGRTDNGAAYVVFGKSGGFGSSIALSSLTGATGFKIEGSVSTGYAGYSVSSAGDVNGDGFADIVVGTNDRYDGASSHIGAAYVIFGKASGFGTVDLATLSSTAGFRIQGQATGDFAGRTVSSAGDVNGDGYDDILIGAGNNDSGGADAGAAYVIFGKPSGLGTIDLANLSAASGFKIQGEAAGDGAGRAVSAAGDINGDGADDILVGASGNDSAGTSAGAAYVIYGVPPPHTAPSGTDNTVTSLEDGSRALTATDFGFTDSVDGDSFTAVTIASVPLAGALKLNGTAVTANQSIAKSEIDAGHLIFTPTANANGNGYASFTFQVQDSGPNNAIDTSANTLTFNVTAVDDAPVAVADSATVAANVAADIAVLSNDTDIDGGPKAVMSVDGTPLLLAGDSVTLTSGAIVTLNMDGTLTYDANGAFDDLAAAGSGAVNTQATDSFNYVLNGGSSATVTVTVSGVDGPGNEVHGDGGDNVFRLRGDPALIDGGGGTDRVVVHGNSHVTISDNSVTGIQRFTVRDHGTLDLSAVHDSVAKTLASLSVAGGHTTTIIGTQGDDVIVGGLGADDLSGAGGDDIIRLQATPLHIDGGSGFDRVSIAAGVSIVFDDTSFTGIEKVLLNAGASVDLSGVTTGVTINAKAGLAGGVSIIGTQGDDVITGSDNGDTLTGGAGRDVVHGGLGADTFVFASLDDFASTGFDRIADFSRTDGDTIDLSGIDPDAVLAGDQQFTFIGDAHFTGASGTDYEVRAVDVAPGTTRVFIDINHDANADYSFLVSTDPAITLQASDFSL